MKRANLKRCTALHRRSEGYVLVTTLLIIAMAGILTVGLARHSMNLAVASMQEELELQDRWGMLSCQRFAFGASGRLMRKEQYDRQTGTIVVRHKDRTTCTVLLGDHEFRIRLDDESAKLDINHLFKNAKRKTTQSIIRKYCPDRSLAIKLSPLNRALRRKPTEDSFEAWGQVFTPTSAEVGFGAAIHGASDRLTCWSRHLNFGNCSDEVLFESARVMVGSNIAKQLVGNRSQGISDVKEAVEQTQATGDQQTELKRYLRDHSTAQSVWVQSTSGTQSRHYLSIRESVTGTLSRFYSFSW